jgi:hypothetical protein
MPKTAKPKYAASDLSWIAAYVAAHGEIQVTIDGHEAAVAADGTLRIADKAQRVEVWLAVPAPQEAVDGLTAAVPSWVATWRERGFV